MNSTPDLISPQKSSENSNAELPSSSSQVMNMPDEKGVQDDFQAEADQILSNPNTGKGAYVTVSICCVMVAFGGFVFGWDTGTISGFVAQTDFLRRFGMKHHDGSYYLSKVRTGLIVAIFNIGCAVGGIVLAKLGDMYGRKLGLIVVVVIYIIGIIIQIASIDKWYQYFIGRIISGLGVGGIAVLSPMLISEVAPKDMRGTLVSCYQLMITLGIFLGYCTNFGTKNYSNSVQWRVPLGLCFAWALFMIGGMTFVPESPRYLVEAVNKVAPDHPFIQQELETIEASVEEARAAGSASWGELFTGKPAMFKRTMMGIMIQSLQQLTGDNYFFYYGTTVFNAVVDRFGRRNCLLYGAIGMVCCYVVYASVGVTKLWPNGEGNGSSKGAGNCMICFACFYIFCFATTWAPIAYVVISETFPLRVKSKAMSIATAANWFWGFLIGFFTPFITGAINFYYGYVFMGCMVFAYFYVFFVPETKGLSLEEVNDMYAEGVLPWKSASWVPTSRRGADYNADALMHDDQPFYKSLFSRK
ncbi:Low-affinity glucose transporter hxt3 [Saccharomyces pastorianus]|uniref:Low-affinity glucose transporter hxt3 n=1 Tax=Saccharomyces pastorianus TaxID=27292 RepID=A0A6C1E454_SACPS|nr:Low-affinity glucose transporter hxt3 [Saccharomyces pastorianus]